MEGVILRFEFVALYRTPYCRELLPGFYEDCAVIEREQLQILFEQKIAYRLETLEKEQRWQDILEWAERWISLAQTPQAAHRA